MVQMGGVPLQVPSAWRSGQGPGRAVAGVAGVGGEKVRSWLERSDRLYTVSAALPILFRDQALVAVDKPAGLAVHRGWAGARDVAMMRVRDQLGMYVFPVHRLD